MSFEVYLQCFRGGVGASVPLAAVRGMFSHVADDSEPDRWRLWYDERNSCDVYVTPRGDRVEGFMVSRPCGDVRLWDSLYRVLQLGPWVLYFPSAEPSLVVADLAHVKELPPDMVETLGPARRVGSGREILEMISGP